MYTKSDQETLHPQQHERKDYTAKVVDELESSRGAEPNTQTQKHLHQCEESCSMNTRELRSELVLLHYHYHYVKGTEFYARKRKQQDKSHNRWRKKHPERHRAGVQRRAFINKVILG